MKNDVAMAFEKTNPPVAENSLAFVAKQKCVLLNLNGNKMFTGRIRDLVGQN